MLPSLRSPHLWLASFVLWFAVLWLLSSSSQPAGDLPPIPLNDKILHFGYFLGGGGLLSAYFYRRNPDSARWPRIVLMVTVICGLLGIVDEIHQTFTPGRSGNDPYDLLADVFGALSGSLLFRRFHRVIS